MDKRYQVFVSSTYADLRDEREKVINELTRIGYIAAGMEQFPATDEEQLDYIQRIIDESDYYVIIVRRRYGALTEDGVSFTEKEFEYAIQTKKPILAFLFRNLNALQLSETDNDPSKMAKLQAFRKRLEDKRIVRYWTDIPDLVSAVKDSVNDMVRRRPGIGWVRGDQAINPAVINELEELRKENAELKARLNEHGDAVVSFPSHLAHGDDALKVAYKVYETRRTQDRIFDTVKHLIQEGRYVTSWDEMLLRLSGAMYRE